MDRPPKVAQAVNVVAAAVLKAILMEWITKDYSEAYCDTIVQHFSERFTEHLIKDFDFKQVVSEQDVVDEKGNLNAEAVMAGLDGMSSRMTRPGQAERIRHLRSNFKHVFTDLRLLRGEPSGKTQT